MPLDTRRIGVHLPLGRGLLRAADRAIEIGAGAIQVFGDNPTAWRRRTSPPKDLAAFLARLAGAGIAPLAIHASYLVNLAGPSDEFRERSIALLAHELRTAVGYGAEYVNVHAGSHGGAGLEAGTERLAEGVARALAEADGLGPDGERTTDTLGPDGDGPADPVLVIENSSGGGYSVGASLDEIEAIIDAIAARGVPERRVAICLDTAHLWGAGVDISRPDEADAFLDALDRRVGLDRVALIHLNDSRAPLGSRADRHEHLGGGLVGALGLAHLLTHPRLAGAVHYLETPGMDAGYDAVNLARARDLAAGRPLAPLPAEAFALRGSRSLAAHPPDEDAGEAGTNPEIDW